MNFETEIPFELDTLNMTLTRLLSKCIQLSNTLCVKGHDSDSITMKEISSRIFFIKYKIDTVIEFLNVLKTAEEKNFDLGDRVKAAASFYYANLLTELRDESDYSGLFFADQACLDFLKNWGELCRQYRKYFTKTMKLPKTLDTKMNKFTEEIAKEIEY